MPWENQIEEQRKAKRQLITERMTARQKKNSDRYKKIKSGIFIGWETKKYRLLLDDIGLFFYKRNFSGKFYRWGRAWDFISLEDIENSNVSLHRNGHYIIMRW